MSHPGGRARRATRRAGAGAYCRRLDRQPGPPDLEEGFELDPFGRIGRPGLGTHAGHAVAQAALQRTECLPFQAVQRVAVRMTLRDRGAAQASAPARIVAVGAGQVELAHPPFEQATAAFAHRIESGVGIGPQRQAPGRMRDECRQRQALDALRRPARQPLVPGPALRDPLRQPERLAPARIPARIPRCHIVHRVAGLAVTVGARSPCRPLGTPPPDLAVADRQHSRVGSVVALHRLGRRPHRREPGDALIGRQTLRRDAGDAAGDDQERRRVAPAHLSRPAGSRTRRSPRRDRPPSGTRALRCGSRPW